MIQFERDREKPIPETQTTFADYTLLVGPVEHAYRLSVDTLTLYFTPDEQILLGLEAYTNPAKWQAADLTTPTSVETAALICLNQFDENGIASVDQKPLFYRYDKSRNRLKISIGTGESRLWVQSVSGLICGLTDTGHLIEMWVESVEVDQ